MEVFHRTCHQQSKNDFTWVALIAKQDVKYTVGYLASVKGQGHRVIFVEVNVNAKENKHMYMYTIQEGCINCYSQQRHLGSKGQGQ